MFAVWNIFLHFFFTTFGSKYNWYFGLTAILFIYNFTIHTSLKVGMISSFALTAPEDSAQASRHLLKPMPVIVCVGFSYALVICFTNGQQQAVTVVCMCICVCVYIYTLKDL